MDKLATITTVVGAVAGPVRAVLVVVQGTHQAAVVLRVLQTVYQVAAQAVADVRIHVLVAAQEAVRGVVLTRVWETVLQAVRAVVLVGVLGGNCD